MSGQVTEARQLIDGKIGEQLRDLNQTTKFLVLILRAYEKRSLLDLLDIFGKFEQTAKEDKIIRLNLETLYQSLLQQNILKLVKPYDRV